MKSRAAGDTRWGAVVLGWLVAVAVGVVISPILRLLYGSFAGPPLARGELTATLVVVSLVSGFLAYLSGGYVAARAAGRAGGMHGALAAVLGMVLGIVLAVVLTISGVTFAEGVALPPATFGLARAALLAGLMQFLANLFGGYVGGMLGEPSRPRIRRA